jgi:hypothetical protein
MAFNLYKMYRDNYVKTKINDFVESFIVIHFTIYNNF